MKEKWKHVTKQMTERFKARSNIQKGLILGGSFLFIAGFIFLTIMMSRPNLVPLYSNLSPQEAGQIQENLNSKGVANEVRDGGKTILVPEEQVNNLQVQLAAEGLPESGNIDFSYFGEKSGFGITDKEFGVLEREATQTEISNLIKSINGVEDANVMITLPESSVWVNQEEEMASASVVLSLGAGAKLDEDQVKALYHLVSKSVTNLPMENIVITDQYFNYYDLNSVNSTSSASKYEEQRKIKQDVERDLQRRVQQMLSTIMGQGKVVATVTTDIDFTEEKREETIVEPVDQENMKGIEVSVERIRETFTGEGAAAGGVVGTGDQEVPTYPGSTAGSNGDYEKVEERINNEVNKIRKEIVESPYQIRDLGIQVMVEPPTPNKPESLPQERLDDIEQILSAIVRTSISKDVNNELTEEQIQEKIFVSAQPFNGKQETSPASTGIPFWIYIVGGVLLLVIILLIFLLSRKKKREEEGTIEEYDIETQETYYVPDVNKEQGSEGTVRKEQLERMAKEKPEEFAKLVRTWLSEE
ncbi:flagellar basal-body MS-ring/collar protein FliF [Fictibacillus barbaricus]|uniref:Flagellar M-ring protein n=1 Tax=Fictibacillus barbaricus TaxID=182136 RepID=A0ABS2ZD34_9BACL|nr:flagellar basal-body MS-ring/collar protein FliF [Fictibacillus barbaricus]MBN3545850.1 flagellar M-ring protein FliF [Fictibacillus barbaricus]GGB56636.1 flagellar M-ring protein [Fictibacillus barbaricus]